MKRYIYRLESDKLRSNSSFIKGWFVLAHGLSIEVNAQGLLHEQNYGKGENWERANQLNLSLLCDDKTA